MVLGISFFDLLSSVAYFLNGVMTPVENGFYQAFGNISTCRLQGFMIQLGYTSIFYNLGLSLYFWFVICRSWKERQFKRWIIYVHLLVLTAGFGLAFAGLPFYGSQINVCHVSHNCASFPDIYYPCQVLLDEETFSRLLLLCRAKFADSEPSGSCDVAGRDSVLHRSYFVCPDPNHGVYSPDLLSRLPTATNDAKVLVVT